MSCAPGANPGGEVALTARPKGIGRDEVRRLISRGAALIEVLPPAEYEAEHIAGARHIHLKELDRAAVARLDPGSPVVVYCSDSL